jgi:hypothetical protein
MHDTSERRWEGDTMARGKSYEKKSKEKTNRETNKKQANNNASDAAGKKNADDATIKAKKASENSKAEKVADAAGSKKNPRMLKWEQPENLVLLEGWARKGLSMEQIAHNMGISKDTLYRWARLSSDISDAIKKGKEVTDFMVENALFTAAISGNVVAQIFWLKNRAPEAWKDKVEQKIETDADTTGGILVIAPRLEANNG